MSPGGGIIDLQRQLHGELSGAGADAVGFADTAGMPLAERLGLSRGVAILVAHPQEAVRRCAEDVHAFERHLRESRRRADGLADLCARRLREHGFSAWLPPHKENLPGLVGYYSYKRLATAAGLGWVGRNSLLVSPRHGPAVRLDGVLTDAPFVPADPLTESRCGDCSACVEACPCGAIRGADWHPGIDREELLDVTLCSRFREQSAPELGFKHPCGLCMAACPVGGDNAPDGGSEG
jgi:epoxyqueuosine reductase QueG